MTTATHERALVAELALLERYDNLRVRVGHDYGCGQRAGELSRRRRELRAHGGSELLTLTVTRDELEQAFERVGVERLRRAENDYRLYGSQGAARTLATWRRMQLNYGGGGELDA